jgi:hypothetical protein
MNRTLVWWAYAVEIIAAGSTLLLICLLFPMTGIEDFFKNAALDIATLFGAVMLAAALAYLWTFFSKADTPFYRWLDEKNAFNTYLYATAYSVGVSFVSTVSLLIAKHIQDTYITLIALFFLLLAIINLYTLVGNVIGLMKLNTLFLQLERKGR